MKLAGIPLTLLTVIALTLTGCAAEPECSPPIDLPNSSVSITDGTETQEQDSDSTNASGSETSNSESTKPIEPKVNSTIQDYAENATLTASAAELFFSTEPIIVDAETLRSKCSESNASSEANVLGCFTTNPNRIYLYDILDDRMSAVENVIAAHELLHAVWYLELSAVERNELTKEMQTFFSGLPVNHFLRDRLKLYSNSPDTIPTELHSILGTESLVLTPALEAHYAKYFKNRAEIVEYSEATFGYIRDLSKQVKEGSATISKIRSEIDSERVTLSAENTKLTNDVEAFNARAQSGQLSKSQYEREKALLDERKTTLETAYDKFNDKVDNFNTLVKDNNELAALVNELNASISTK